MNEKNETEKFFKAAFLRIVAEPFFSKKEIYFLY